MHFTLATKLYVQTFYLVVRGVNWVMDDWGLYLTLLLTNLECFCPLYFLSVKWVKHWFSCRCVVIANQDDMLTVFNTWAG